MKHRFSATIMIFTLGALIFVAPAFAQSARLVVDIDHDFTVGTVSFPAGKYAIGRATRNNERLFLIESVDSRHKATQFAAPKETGEISHENVLTFARYGDEYFLTSIRTAGDDRVFRFSASTRERELLGSTGRQPELIDVRASNGHR